MMHLSFVMRSGGTTRETLNFNLDGYRLLDGYYPVAGRDQPVTESFDILITESLDADLRSKINTIEEMLDFARRHPTGPDGVWMLFSPHNDIIDEHQTRLSGGDLFLNESLVRYWRNIQAKVQVVIVRDPYFEAVNAVTLQLTNRGGTDASADIVNHQDTGATDDFYVEIAADQVEGAIPAPAVIEIKNTVNNATLMDQLFVGHFAASDPYDPPAASSLILEGSGTADANCSGGEYEALTWTDDAENELATWTIAVDDYLQRYYKMIARLRATVAYTDLFLKLKLLSGTVVLAETRWALVSAGETLQVIGSLRIPPYKQGLYVDLGNLTLALYEKRAAGSGTMHLDFIAALPMDSWRKYAAIVGLAYNETLIDDPVNSILYSASGAAYKLTHIVEEGEPVMLVPGVKNVLYFLQDITTGAAAISRTSTVVVKYHPRRRTV